MEKESDGSGGGEKRRKRESKEWENRNMPLLYFEYREIVRLHTDSHFQMNSFRFDDRVTLLNCPLANFLRNSENRYV